MQRIKAWRDWFEGLGDGLIEGGNGTVIHHEGDHSFGGYCLLEVVSLNDAITCARDCPILAAGGRVELLELGERGSVLKLWPDSN